MTGYYDYVLGLIPAALLGVTAFLNLVGLSLTAALPGGALVAGGVMLHAMFVRNPVTDSVGDGTRVRPGRLAGRSAERSAGRARSDEASN
jgi:Na+-translocating ferredoxin:NAD+ oxidoreductase RnfD subunit